MAASMEEIARKAFTKATLVTDRFHVQKLAYDAVQQMRTEYRWQAIEQEHMEMELSKELVKAFIAGKLENGDSQKQLPARSRYLLFKRKDLWTSVQRHRAKILFSPHQVLEQTYELSQQLGYIYRVKEKGVAYTKLARWYAAVEKAGSKSFNTISRTIQLHYQTILNYFENRSTNAATESFDAKTKAFRSQFRGVRNVDFFLFRLAKIYA